jgi:predicted 2-oxoglutarate/Fe(II)-dependent dioxygenase YbiX
VLFLNDRSTYGGGELTFHGEYPNWTERHVAPASAGTLVAFRSEMTHEVTPLTYGDRYTAVTWYR